MKDRTEPNLMHLTNRVSEIVEHLNKPYRTLIQTYLFLKSSKAIQDAKLETSLALPDAIQNILHILNAKISLYALGNNIWEKKTSEVVTAISIIFENVMPNYLTGERKADGTLLSLLLDLNTLSFARIALDNPDFCKSCGIDCHIASTSDRANKEFFLVCPNCKCLVSVGFSRPIKNTLKLRTCVICEKTAWFTDVVELDIAGHASKDFTIRDLVDKIITGFDNSKENEIHLRKMLWWKINDIVRYDPDNSSFSVKHYNLLKKNLLELVDLLNDEEVETRITKAEIYRELSDFDMAAKYLEKLPEKESARSNLIRKLCLNKDARVALVGEVEKLYL